MRNIMKMRGMIFGWVAIAFGAMGQEIPASRVTLSVKNASMEEVYQAISESSGNRTMTQFPEKKNPGLLERLTGGDGPRMDFEAKDEAYWSLIKRFCETNKLTVVQPPDAYRESVYLMPGNAILKMPTAMSGGCLFQIKGAMVEKTQDFKNEPQRRIKLEMIMGVEPKAKVIKAAQAATIEKAVSDDGKPLVIESKGEPALSDVAFQSHHRLSAEVKYEAGVKKLATLSGKVWMIQEVKSEDWVFTDAGKVVGATQTVCDADTLKITRWEIENGFVVLEMDIRGTASENLISPEFLVRNLRYEDAEGKVVTGHFMGGNGWGMSEGKMNRNVKIQTFVAQNGNPKMPAKMTIKLPGEVKAVAIPFEFKDVETP